jgi:hypothetical protein
MDWTKAKGAIDLGKISNNFDKYKSEALKIIENAKNNPNVNPNQVISPWEPGEGALHIELKLKK